MLIRSQDNKKLVNINRVLQLDIEEYRKDRGYYYSKSYDMGEQHYAEFQKSVLCPSMYPCKPIFQMPEEEEISVD